MVAHNPDVPKETTPLITGLISVVQATHADMTALVAGVDVEGLKWMPTPNSPHLAGLVLHVLEFEDYLAGLVAGAPAEWTGSLGSSNSLVMRDRVLVARIAATEARLTNALLHMAAGRLQELCPGEETTIGESLVEDLAHASLHLGQMQLTRQLMVRVVPLSFPDYTHWA